MKRRRTDFAVVLIDGGIRLGPGMWICLHVDTPFNPTLNELQIWMRNLRGAFLSQVFGLENELIRLSLASDFGTMDPGTAPAGYFDREQEFREEHSLERKIERAKPIIRQHRERIQADRLIQNLAECRVVRNLMAHYPCWIEPVNNEELKITVAFKLFIGDRNHVWELEEGDVTYWFDLFIQVQRELLRLMHEITGSPAPNFTD